MNFLFSACDNTARVYSSENINGKFIHFQDGNLQVGWFNAYINGKQFVPPSIDEINGIFTDCLIQGHGYVLLGSKYLIFCEFIITQYKVKR